LGEDGLKPMTQLINSIYCICNWRVAQRFNWSYNDCLEVEAQSYKMQWPSHLQQ
jgi:hypothetical protein